MLVYSSDVIESYKGVLDYLDEMKSKYARHSLSFSHDLRIVEQGFIVLIKL